MSYSQPAFPFLIIATVLLFARYWRTSARKPRLLAVALGCVVFISCPPVAWMASRSLEGWYDQDLGPTDDAQAIVVLAGGFSPARPGRPQANVRYDTYIRCRYAAWLYRNRRALPILTCGNSESQQSPNLADAMRTLLENEGVPSHAIWQEDRSRSTYENARFGAELLREHGIDRVILVTEAFHMVRATASFRKQGIEVIPAPCAFRSARLQLDPLWLLPGSTPIRQNEETLHEWLGLVWYRLRGRL